MAAASGRQLAGVGQSSSNNNDGGANDMKNVMPDIEHWYGMNEPHDQQDKDDLILSVETVAAVGNYATEEKGGQFFVSCGTGDKLRLAEDKAREYFLRYVKEAEVPDDIDLDFQRAIEDPKS
jgi:hypothetical protein